MFTRNAWAMEFGPPNRMGTLLEHRAEGLAGWQGLAG